MSITFPTTLDSFPNPISTDLLENATAALDHDVQHSNANDAIEAIEAKLGIDGSAVTTSHSYKLSNVATGDKAVSLTGTETLTNKTLTAPKIALGSDAKGDMFQLSDANGTLTRLRATTNGDIISWNDGTDQWEAIPNPAGSNASTTVKGVVEEGTLAQVLARTGTGETGARLFVGPENLTTVQTYDYAVDSVGTDSYAITVAPAPTAYVAGQVFRFKAGTANTDGATLNVNGLGAKTIVKNVSDALETGDILANQIVEVIYNGTNMQVKSALTPQTINTTINTIVGTRQYFTSQLHIDADLGWTFTGTPTYRANGVSITSSGSVNTYFNLQGHPTDYDNTLDWNSGIDGVKVNYLFTPSSVSSGAAPSGAGDIWFFHGFGTSNAAQNGNITLTSELKVGFSHYNGKIYTVTCDASAITATEVDATDDGQVKKVYSILFTPSSVGFYINGSLVSTHTTNIPSNGNAMTLAFSGYDGSNNSVGIAVSHITLGETLT